MIHQMPSKMNFTIVQTILKMKLIAPPRKDQKPSPKINPKIINGNAIMTSAPIPNIEAHPVQPSPL